MFLFVYLAALIIRYWNNSLDRVDKVYSKPFTFSVRYFLSRCKWDALAHLLNLVAYLHGYGYADNVKFVKDCMDLLKED